MTNYYKSEIHRKTLEDALERYKNRPIWHLLLFKDIYESFRKDAISNKDSRWKTPQAEDKLCVKEHLKLIKLALETKSPPSVIIKCNPAVMGMKDGKQA